MAKKRPMKLDDLFKLRAVGAVSISPDGSKVAFELKRFDLEQNKNFVNIMLVDVGGGKPRTLTRGNHVDLRPRWSPDGTRLAFTSDRNKGRTLWVLDMTGGEPRRITEPDGCVADFAFSPNGNKIVFTWQAMSENEKLARDGKDDALKKKPQFKRITRLFHKFDGAGYWNGNRTHVWITSARGGKPKQLTRGDYDDSEPRFSADGKRVSFVSNRMENPDYNQHNADIYVVKPTGGAIRKITRMEGGAWGHSWSPDGEKIAFIGNSAKCGAYYKHLDRVWLVGVKGGRPRELTREIDNECYNATICDVAGLMFDANPPIWSADSSRIWFAVTERGATHLYTRSLGRKDTRTAFNGNVNVYDLQRSGASGPIALAIGSATNPGDVFVFDPDADKEPRQLTHVNADALKRVHVGEPQEITVKSGKVDVQTWVLKPPGFNANKKYPAILEIHGGPQAQYGYSFFHEMQWMAAKGYVVVFGNPRGSAGYGLKHRNCIQHDWGNLDYKDVSKIADWLFRRKYVDSKRVGVTGGSYGGYMTNWLVGHTHRFRAAVTQRSVVSFESFYGISDMGFEPGWIAAKPPWEDPRTYRKQSPLTFAKNIKTPLLIIHSEEDWRCPVSQADELFTVLKVLGRETELIRFEGESHGLSRGGRPQNRGERLRVIMAWMDTYLK